MERYLGITGFILMQEEKHGEYVADHASKGTLGTINLEALGPAQSGWTKVCFYL